MALYRFLIKFVNLIFYGNFWIATAAAALTLQTQYVLIGKCYLSPVVIFVFFSTLLLYALHRIVGLNKVKAFQDKGRYLVISTFKSHILFYAGISALICLYYLFLLPRNIQISLLFPAIISLAYVLPILGKNRRLRDFNHIKIFMIMLSWAWVTVILPALELNMLNFAAYPMFLERALFIFAITLPFDIRDLKVDAHNEVKTIPSKWGLNKSIALAIVLICLAWLMAYLNFRFDVYDSGSFLALSISFVSTAVFIWYSKKVAHDYYYTGLLDGTMIIQFLLVYFIG